MIRHSLRLRLVLAFSVLVGLVLFVGIVSYGINEQVRRNVSELQPADRVDLSGIDIQRSSVEFEGFWNPAGAFVATQLTEEPEPRRPQLRGRIQAVSPQDRTITMYGIRIQVSERTEGDRTMNGLPGVADLSALSVGKRVEVTCKVDESTGAWSATKLELQNVKSSDKVKGMITTLHLDGQPPESCEIHGITIILQAVQESGPETAFGRIEHGTRMLRALQRCRAAAHRAVDMESGLGRGGELDQSAALEMDREAAAFEQVLADASSPSSRNKAAVPGGESLDHLLELNRRVPRLQELVALMHNRVDAGDQPQAAEFLNVQVEPYLDHELMPFVHAYLIQAEDDLGDELREVLDRTGATTRVALATSVIAVVVAGFLGLMVWRSIHRPIQLLHAAAIDLGHGKLDTRVKADGRDELAVLARAFNGMAEKLASSTVSVTSLQGMFDAMAAAVILCDGEGRILQVNDAAVRMLSRSRASLTGAKVQAVCRFVAERNVSELAAASAARGGSLDRSLICGDGNEAPASLSCAPLGSSGGEARGYVLVAQDLTPLKAIEEQLRESLAEKELLLREVHHRVKNNMQVISSLLAMQSTSGDPEVLRRMEESQNRIRTIALIHEQLYQSSELAHIDTSSYLQVLGMHLLQSFGRVGEIDLIMDIDNLQLDLDQSLACGLIVNELLTNCFKYAFPNGRSGKVLLRLKQQADGSRLLEVADNGQGLQQPAQPGRRTLGTSLVNKLARQLRGRVTTVSEDGMTVSIQFEGKAQTEPAAT